ncbi:MAG: superoxide dismutase [Paludibacteraceae bacterium]|nr:superoxide dismutase [Paludibacteraceae bacterium]
MLPLIFTLISLPYAPEALEPVISRETIAFHHGKHLQTYVDNLNKLIAGTEFEHMSLEQIVCKAQGGIFNNAGQILNHNLYFTQFSPAKDDNHTPKGAIMDAINRDFGSFDAFKAEFEQKGVTLFGSGWVWLAADNDGKLLITQEPNAGNPVTKGLKPLLTMDVWEHAYYIDFQNRRAAHLQALWQIINWDEINHRYNN